MKKILSILLILVVVFSQSSYAALRTKTPGLDFFVPNVTAKNFIFTYDTTTQTIAVIDTYQVVTFNTNGLFDGWLHTPGTGDFTSPANGIYLMTASFIGQKVAGVAGNMDTRFTIDGTEIAGSQGGIRIDATTFIGMAGSKTVLATVLKGEVLRCEISASGTNFSLTPGPSPGGAVTPISIKMSIIRIA